jgi:cell wall-associated NlpC family hydrolase
MRQAIGHPSGHPRRLLAVFLLVTACITGTVSGTSAGTAHAVTVAPARPAAIITTTAYVTPALTAEQQHLAHLARLAQLRYLASLHTAGQAPAVTGIAAYARSFAGPPHYYLYGGEGPLGFDCSGLAQVVYAHFGLHIPRVADAQAGYLHRTSSPAPGDLVFYWAGGYAYHTAIYLGAGLVVSALNPAEGIRVTPVSWPADMDIPAGWPSEDGIAAEMPGPPDPACGIPAPRLAFHNGARPGCVPWPGSLGHPLPERYLSRVA